jgi:hypothetical protein
LASGSVKKTTAGRRIRGIGDLALYNRDGFGVRLERRYRRQQRLGVRVARLGKQRIATGGLHQLSEIHHRHVIAEMLHHAKVMGDKQKGNAEIVAQIGKQVDDLRLDRDIQRRDRLVGNDKVRVENQRPGNPDTLALTAENSCGKRL